MSPTPDDPDRRWTCEDCGKKVVGDAAALAHCDEFKHSLAMGREELDRLGIDPEHLLPGLPDVVKWTPGNLPGGHA